MRERERKEPMKKDTHITEGTEKVDDHDGFLKDIKRFFFFSSSSSSSHYAHTQPLFIVKKKKKEKKKKKNAYV